MGLFSRFFGGSDGRNNEEHRSQQDAGGNPAQAIDKQGGQCDPESLRAADDLTARAQQLRAQVRFDDAEPLFRQSLAILEGACGPDHPRVASALCDLASVLRDYDEAESVYRRSLAIAEGAYGSDHPNLVIPLHGMALALEIDSRYQEAEPLYRRCLEICEAAYGPDDPKVASILQRIAATLEGQSRYEEAEPLLRRSLAIMEVALGPDDPNVAKTRKELETLLSKSHRTGMLRREGGKKYLSIDGAHAVVHACSTVENYLDRCLSGGLMFGGCDLNVDELRWFQDGTMGTSDFVRVEMQECCYCGASFQIPMRFPNTSDEVECSECGRAQVFYVVQMTAGLEQALGMENRLGSGYSVIWLTVPSLHPEFSALLAQHGMVTWGAAQSEGTAAQFVNTWQDVRWFEGPGGEAWWPGYSEKLRDVEVLAQI